MAILRPITKAQYEVSFASGGGTTFTSVFTKFSGVNDSSDTSTYANGTGNRLYHVVGPRTADNVTLTAPYDPTIFKALELFWLNYNCEYITVTVTPRDCSGKGSEPSAGGQYLMYECRFVSITTGEVDRESGDVQEIEIEMTVNYWDRV
jgi:hypothetical protein